MTDFDLSEVIPLLNAAHLRAHELPSDPEDTLVVALTLRDFALIAIGLPLVELAFPCLRADQGNLQDRLIELRDIQKADNELWTTWGRA